MDKTNDHLTKIIRGQSLVKKADSKVSAIDIEEKPLFLKELDEASIVWICENMEDIIQRVCVQVKNIADLRRLIIYTINPESVARVMKTPDYAFVFEHEALKIAVLDPQSTLSFQEVFDVFEPTVEDREHRTTILSNFPDDSPYRETWNRQVLGLHELVLFMAGQGNHDHGVTHDSYLGFKNTVRNLPKILKHPDVRNLGGIFKNKPCFILGAGPSISSQLEWLKKYQDLAVIIAADTMLTPLTEKGIRPHVIASLERSPEVITLLDIERKHPETLLVASSVLDPECLEKYQGPISTYFSYQNFCRYFPFPRSRFRTGHSCVGLAMALAGYFECGPIFLMGIDLCWSTEGSSHMPEVPYLNEDFYKTANQLAHDQSFRDINSKGEIVETNQYWTMFRKQFESWAKDVPGKVYNLSQTGLPFADAELITLDQVDERRLISEEKQDYSKILLDKLAYDVTEERRNALAHMVERADISRKWIIDLIKLFKEVGPREEARELFKKHRLSEALFEPILQTSLVGLSSKKEEERQLAFRCVHEHLDSIADSLQEASEVCSQLIEEQKRKGFPLF